MRGQTEPYAPPMAFKAITTLFIVLTAALLSWGLTHVSDTAVVLARFSATYSVLLLGMAAVLAVLLVATLHPSPLLTRVLTNTYLVAGSTIISLFVVEFALRVLNPWGVDLFHNLPYHMQGMVDDKELGYVHPRSISYFLGKNLISLNSHGLRDEEMPLAKPAGEKRIVVLGDSVTFGWGVNQGEAFPDRMEPMLRQLTGKYWQVINAGVNGYNSSQEAAWFRLHGIHFQPDIVVLIYVSNDVEPMIDPNLTTWRRYPSWPDSLPELMYRIRSMSYLFQMAKLMRTAHELQQAREKSPSSGASVTVTGHPGWPASLAALGDIAIRCRELRIPFFVAQESGFDIEFDRQLTAHGIDTISLGAIDGNLPVEQQYVSRVDPHPSAAVHRLIARGLVDALERRGVLR